MAFACSRIAQRTSISSIKSAIKFNIRASSFSKTTSSFSPIHQSLLTRISQELRCTQSMLLLHSTVVAARMTSCLTFKSCRALSPEFFKKEPRWTMCAILSPTFKIREFQEVSFENLCLK
ncbi:hypothetical protein GLYMA_17G210100v4 [Glycine max]|uniref:uncharacterized protein isoform X2 n=1 Tax=Glycine max TaxID=3847 RepID=UPI001B354CD8|nr:uncharacterized protein LOC100781088 isoform X2 [Glycine max]KAG4379244.1 hypothetical protein GLYMA_17G210100v4 [Glycine max]KAH1119398.1 hypothetical protein GYH30_047978 [Glycine max]